MGRPKRFAAICNESIVVCRHTNSGKVNFLFVEDYDERVHCTDDVLYLPFEYKWLMSAIISFDFLIHKP